MRPPLTKKEESLYRMLVKGYWYHHMISDLFPALFQKGYVSRQETDNTIFYRKVEGDPVEDKEAA